MPVENDGVREYRPSGEEVTNVCVGSGEAANRESLRAAPNATLTSKRTKAAAYGTPHAILKFFYTLNL